MIINFSLINPTDTYTSLSALTQYIKFNSSNPTQNITFLSDETVRVSHEWSEEGNYDIRVKAKDDPNGDGNLSDGDESVWSDPLSIRMPINKENNELVKIVILDTRDNKITDKYITSDVYNKIFKDYKPENKLFSLTEYINNNLNNLVDSNIISLEKSNQLRNDLKILNRRDNSFRNILPLKNDVNNIFNGIFFKLEGEKVSSIFDMNILDYPILNTNITALFSGYSSFEGSGLIFSIGFFGLQSILEYSFIGQPHFLEIKGSIIGFTGILIVSRGIIGSEDLKILGIGMNILTSWNRV